MTKLLKFLWLFFFFHWESNIWRRGTNMGFYTWYQCQKITAINNCHRCPNVTKW